MISNQNGSALLVVLVVVAIVAASVLGFSASAVIELKGAASFRDRLSARWGAHTAILAATEIINSDNNTYDSQAELWGQRNTAAIDEYKADIKIIDQDGKLAVNSLVTAMGNINVSQKERLTRLFSILGFSDPEGTVYKIADAIDADTNPRAAGCELGSLNAFPIDLSELIAAKAITVEELEKAAPYLTTLGSEAININTAHEITIMALADEIDDIAARLITDKRGSIVIKDPEELKSLPGAENWFFLVEPDIKTTSRYYTISSDMTFKGARVKVDALYDKGTRQIMYWSGQ